MAVAAVIDVLWYVTEKVSRPLLPGAEVVNVLEHSEGGGLEALPIFGDVSVQVAV